MVPLIWAFLGLLMVVSEFFVPEFVIFFFGLGALLNSALVALFPMLSIPLQILTFLGFSAASLFGLRRYVSRWFRGRAFSEEDQKEYLGKSARVIEAIEPEKPGRIRFGGTTWVAESYTEYFRPGDRVEIIKRDGMHFVVTVPFMNQLPDDSNGSDNE